MADHLQPVISFLENLVRPAARALNTVGAAMLFIMPLPVFFDVASRLIFSGSIPGAIEIEEFMLVIIVFCGLAHTQANGGHINIDLLVSKLSEDIRHIIAFCVNLICALLFGLMASQLIMMGLKKISNNELSFTLEIPVHYFRFIAAAGVIVLAAAVLLEALRSLQKVLIGRRWGWLILCLTICTLIIITPMAGWIPLEWSGAPSGVLGMCLLFFLLFLGMPIGYGMALAGFLGMVVVYGGLKPSLGMLGIGSYDTAAAYMLTVVPLFILMGEFAYHSGISKDLFDTSYKWLGRLPGGLAMSSVAGCAGFSAVCGDSLATAVTMGTVALPGMRKHEYSPSLATGCLAAGGTLGILIPPSVGFIFYAIVTEESIGRLFIAGIIPGLLLATLFILTIYLMARFKPELAPRGEASTFKEKIVSLKGVVGMLLLFALILGGILGGIFSPVEGGAVGAVGAFLYALIRGRVNRKMISVALRETLTITTKLLMILIGVGLLGYFLAATRLPFTLAEFVTGLEVNRFVVFGAVIALFILLGCLLIVIPMILLILPTIFPSMVALGFDPIWFGVVTVLVMEMGQITPPIGVNVFAIGSVADDVPMQEIFRGIVPFFFCMVLVVLLLVIFPDLALFLPGLFFG